MAPQASLGAASLAARQGSVATTDAGALSRRLDANLSLQGAASTNGVNTPANAYSLGNTYSGGSNGQSAPVATGVGAGSATAAGRVDGKDFFKLARSRLPYDRFHEFLQVRVCALLCFASSCPTLQGVPCFMCSEQRHANDTCALYPLALTAPAKRCTVLSAARAAAQQHNSFAHAAQNALTVM